jgi:DNA-binding NarL/FixJ family response regulator
MFLWERLLRALGYQRVRQVTFEAQQDLLDAVQTLADQERRPADQVTSDLIRQALAQRSAAELYVDHWQQLTPREQQVAALVCLNYTNHQIAARLCISPDTVKSHVHNLLAKFDLHRKADLRVVLSDWDFSAWA